MKRKENVFGFKLPFFIRNPIPVWVAMLQKVCECADGWEAKRNLDKTTVHQTGKKKHPQRTCWTGTKEVALPTLSTQKEGLIVQLQQPFKKISKRASPKSFWTEFQTNGDREEAP